MKLTDEQKQKILNTVTDHLQTFLNNEDISDKYNYLTFDLEDNYLELHVTKPEYISSWTMRGWWSDSDAYQIYYGYCPQICIKLKD